MNRRSLFQRLLACCGISFVPKVVPTPPLSELDKLFLKEADNFERHVMLHHGMVDSMWNEVIQKSSFPEGMGFNCTPKDVPPP